MNKEMDWLGRTLVIAPHPDDEVLGAGGTMAKLSESGQEVFVAIVTTGKPPAYSAEICCKSARRSQECTRSVGSKRNVLA